MMLKMVDFAVASLVLIFFRYHYIIYGVFKKFIPIGTWLKLTVKLGHHHRIVAQTVSDACVSQPIQEPTAMTGPITDSNCCVAVSSAPIRSWHSHHALPCLQQKCCEAHSIELGVACMVS